MTFEFLIRANRNGVDRDQEYKVIWGQRIEAWVGGGHHPGTETTDEMSTHSLSNPSSQVLGHQNRDWKFLCVF